MTTYRDITADAVALQERDEFRAAGWLKIIAPAKVNLHLAIDARRADGYHEATSVMHALALHDVVYMRKVSPDAAPDAPAPAPVEPSAPATPASARHTIHMVGQGDVESPVVDPADNLAIRAVEALARELTAISPLEIRIEKNIPAQAGFGGGSTDAAAALLGAAILAGLDPNDPACMALLDRVARTLGADVPFFLHGGCSVYTGAGDEFVRALAPSKKSVVLVKPTGGVSTAEAYRTFDDDPVIVPIDISSNAEAATEADDIALFNNLAPAAARLMPELAEIRSWMLEQVGVSGALLCGSGAATFGICHDFTSAARVAAAARKRGWWARTTAFSSARVLAISEGIAPQASATPGASA